MRFASKLGCLLLCLFTPFLWAEEEMPLDLREELETRLLGLETAGKINQQLLEEARLNARTMHSQLEGIRLEYQGLSLDRTRLKEAIDALDAEYQLQRHRPVVGTQRQALDQLWDGLQVQRAMLAQNQLDLEAVGLRLQLAEKADKRAALWLRLVENAFQEASRQEQETESQNLQQKYFQQATELRERLRELDTDTGNIDEQRQRRRLNLQLEEIEGRAQLVQDKFRLEDLTSQLAQYQLRFEQLQSGAVRDSANLLRLQVKALGLQLNALSTRLENRLAWLSQQQADVLVQAQDKNLRNDVQRAYEAEAKSFTTLIELYASPQQTAQQLEQDALALEQDLQRWQSERARLSLYEKRTPLPETWSDWQALYQQMQLYIPPLLTHHQSLLQERWRQDAEVLLDNALEFSVFLLIWALLWYGVYRWLDKQVEKSHSMARRVFSQHLLYLGLRLLLMYLSSVSLWLWLFLLRQLLPDSWLLSGLLYVGVWLWLWLLPITVFYLLFQVRWHDEASAQEAKTAPAGTEIDDAQMNRLYNPRLFRHLSWVWSSLVIFSSLVLGVHTLGNYRQDLLSDDALMQLVELTDTVFMLFLALLFFPALMFWHTAMEYLQEVAHSRWMWVLKWVTLLLPASLLVVGLLGLSGYLNFSWMVAASMGLLFITLCIWLLLERLLNDALLGLKSYVMKHSKNSLLWTQDVIPVFHQLLRLGLLVAAVLFLVRWQNVDLGLADSLWHYSLFDLGDKPLHFSTLVLSLSTLFLVWWLGGWSRRVTYRWIYSNINDLGIRHSLSVFTQYAVVLCGVLLAMRISGMDLTTFTVFAGALGVGLGFGLRNLANNYLSGLLLLIERPLRTGDLVQLGGGTDKYCGQVTKIGMRALTVRTWDNEEVIIPNADVMSVAFTNWTHSDNILRTLIWVVVSYEDDEALAKQIMEEILDEHPAVLRDFEHLVMLWQFTERGVLIRLHYHTNIYHHDRLIVRSEIMLQIRQRFREVGLNMPYQQYAVRVQEWERPSPEALGETVGLKT